MWFGPSKMEVECSVDNCEFWDNNFCGADKLKVKTTGDDVAHTSDGTCCKTFVCKGSEKE